MRRRRFFLLGTALFAFACIEDRAAGTADDYVRQETSSHVYHLTSAQLWTEVATLFDELGYALPDQPEADTTAFTEWRGNQRYSVRLISSSVIRTRVQIHWQFRSSGMSGVATGKDPVTSSHDSSIAERERDLELEWELLQRTDPADAAQIERVAAARAEAVFERGCCGFFRTAG